MKGMKKFLRQRERLVHVSKPLVVKRHVVNADLGLHFDELVVTPEKGTTLRVIPAGFDRRAYRSVTHMIERRQRGALA